MLLLASLGVFCLFVPFILLAGQSSEEDQRMRARFAAIRAGRMSLASPDKDVELLKTAGEQPVGLLHLATERLGARLNLPLLLAQAYSEQTPRAVLRLCSFAAVGTSIAALLTTRTLLIGLLAGVAGSSFPILFFRFKARSRTAAMNRVLPEVLDMISRALRAGHSVSAALGIVAEEGPEPARTGFGDVFQKQKFGLPLRDALLELVRSFPSEDLKVLVTAILVQRDTGGNLVQILERTAAVIRERLKLQADVRVHTAQGRMTGWILCLLPVLMLGVLTITNPSYPRVLLEDPLGRKLLYTGVALLCLGGYLIQRIVKGIEV